MKKNMPKKHHPFYKGHSMLDFGEQTEDLLVKTDRQKMDGFLSKYMDLFNPVEEYEKYFQNSAKTVDHILKEVKTFYKKLVIDGGWSEKKYVVVLNDIFENNVPLSLPVLDNKGFLFDKEMLDSQKVRRRRKR